MPLNYSKWDMLELSDDSDIEEHPNVDKKSMIRWKQRDIHEKREARKLLISKLKSELSLNSVLRPRIETIISGLSSSGLDHYRAVQRRMKEDPSPEKPETGAPNQPTYDMMLSQLLSDVFREGAWLVEGGKVEGNGVLYNGKKVDDNTGLPDWATAEVPEGKKELLAEKLEQRLRWHVSELNRRDEQVKKEIEKEEGELKKKITSDDIHEGWSSSKIAPPKPSVWDETPKPKKGKKTEKVETIEMLNPKASSSAAPVAPATEDTDDEEDFGPLSPAGRAFAQIPLGDFEKSYDFIKNDSSVLSSSTHDSLLAEAFDAERRGDKSLAMRCVHQSLLVNYCRQLGKDGVGLFFQKMIQKNPKSITMFNEDFQRTYNRIATRTREILAEEAAAPSGEREQIQLVATDPNMTIAFNLPDGPPPEKILLEGEGVEELDMEQVRAWLQQKWDIFKSFPPRFQEALKTENLDKVNKVLGDMKVPEAEKIVELLQEGGMLSFSEKGVRDMTNQ
ncbi:cell division cycle protein 37 [Cryptococcus neoformans]|nr:cell division cycle protein 37 [Cryptococcus neoformans var. grubii AD1-7a]OXH34005.1 cell division cycle protein 37 [Cryptococcus neoformans var. grubii]